MYKELKYRYVYNYRTKILRDVYYYNKIDEPTHRPKKINRTSGKLLMLLSDGDVHSDKDIVKYIWGAEIVKSDYNGNSRRIIDKETANARVRVEIARLQKKICKMTKIKNRPGIGYYIIGGGVWLE